VELVPQPFLYGNYFDVIIVESGYVKIVLQSILEGNENHLDINVFLFLKGFIIGFIEQ